MLHEHISPEKRSETYGRSLLATNCLGVSGVRLFDSGMPGPTLGITACTHGGETAGIDAMAFLEERLSLSGKLKNGRIFFVIANEAAYRKCLETGNPVECRYVEENMNRCCSADALADPRTVERRRVNDLVPVLAEFDVHFDVHSTYGPSETMAIASVRAAEYLSIMNASLRLEGLPERVSGKPIIDVSERHGAIGLGMETGSVADGEGLSNAVDNVLRLLRYMEMTSPDDKELQPHILPEKNGKSLRVYGAIPIRNGSFRLAKHFSHGDHVLKGTLVAADSECEYVVDRDSVILMPSPVETDLSTFIGEEYCFLAEVAISHKNGERCVSASCCATFQRRPSRRFSHS